MDYIIKKTAFDTLFFILHFYLYSSFHLFIYNADFNVACVCFNLTSTTR